MAIRDYAMPILQGLNPGIVRIEIQAPQFEPGHNSNNPNSGAIWWIADRRSALASPTLHGDERHIHVTGGDRRTFDA